MGKTNLKIEYILRSANNMEFDKMDNSISKKIFEHYNKIPTYTLEKMLSILNVSKPKFKAYLNQIGYKNFTAFKDEIIFEKIVRIKQIRQRYDKFEKDKILSVINQLRKSPIDMNDIDGICYEINKHDRFIAYGSPTLLNLLFDFQVDMKMFDKTVLISSVNDGNILIPNDKDFIGIFTATGRLLGCCDARFQEKVLDTENTKVLISKMKIDNKYIDINLSMEVDNDYYEMHYVFLFIFDLIKTRYYELYIKGLKI